MRGWWHDLVVGVRAHLTNPGVTLVVILTLAFAIAASGAAFSLLNGFFLRPLPVERPEELVRVYSRYASGLQYFTLSYPDFADVRGLTDVFAGVVAEQPVPFSIGLPGSNERVWGELVSGGYFETMRIPLAEGREFDERDAGASPPVVVVNDVLARQFWPGTSAVGRRVTTPGGDGFQVVGVSRYAKHLALGEAPEPYVHFPLRQREAPAMTILVRGSGEPAALTREIRETVRTMDETLPLYNVSTMTDRVAVALLPARAGATAVNAIGLVALLLASLGLYATMAQVVGGRTREIGVRRALGAQDRDVVRLVVRQSGRHVLVGLVAGVLLGLAGSRVLGGLLYGVSAMDPVVFGVAPAALLLVAVVAAWVPARKAVRIDPTTALRHE